MQSFLSVQSNHDAILHSTDIVLPQPLSALLGPLCLTYIFQPVPELDYLPVASARLSPCPSLQRPHERPAGFQHSATVHVLHWEHLKISGSLYTRQELRRSGIWFLILCLFSCVHSLAFQNTPSLFLKSGQPSPLSKFRTLSSYQKKFHIHQQSILISHFTTFGNHYSTFCLRGFAYSRYFIYMESHTMWPFVSCFHLA